MSTTLTTVNIGRRLHGNTDFDACFVEICETMRTSSPNARCFVPRGMVNELGWFTSLDSGCLE